jgi:hypothetical protein
MKDTQGNIITEEEFTKDIGHGVIDPEKEDTWQERFDETFEGDYNFNAYYRGELKSFFKTEIDKAYKLGMCVGVTEEQERWSEAVKMIKNNK